MADLVHGFRQIVPRAALAAAARVPPPSVQRRGVTYLAVLALGIALALGAYGVHAWSSEAPAAAAPLDRVAVLVLVSFVCVVLLRTRRVPVRVQLAFGAAYWVVLAWTLPTLECIGEWLQWPWVHNMRSLDVLLLTFPLMVPLRPAASIALLVTLCLRDTLAMTVLHGGAAQAWHELPLRAWAVLPTTVPWFSAACAFLVYAAHYSNWRALAAWQTWGSVTLKRHVSTSDEGSTWEIATGRFKQRAVAQISPATRTLPEDSYERFETAMQRLAAMRSPNVATVYEYGISQTGSAYCVREQSAGLTWEELVSQHGPLMPERAINLLAQVCDALVEAHGLGLVHGALTARTLLITRTRQDFDVVKVLNFGLLSWLSTKHLANPDAAPAEFVFRGSPEYLAPELVENGKPSSPSSDVYAIGCLGYQLLAGRPPFTGEPQAVLRDQLHTPPPSLAELTAIRPPKDLEQILLDCLAKQAEARPVDMQTVRRRLRACGAATHWHQGRARAWWVANMPEPEPEPVSKRVSRRALFFGPGPEG